VPFRDVSTWVVSWAQSWSVCRPWPGLTGRLYILFTVVKESVTTAARVGLGSTSVSSSWLTSHPACVYAQTTPWLLPTPMMRLLLLVRRGCRGETAAVWNYSLIASRCRGGVWPMPSICLYVGTSAAFYRRIRHVRSLRFGALFRVLRRSSLTRKSVAPRWWRHTFVDLRAFLCSSLDRQNGYVCSLSGRRLSVSGCDWAWDLCLKQITMF